MSKMKLNYRIVAIAMLLITVFAVNAFAMDSGSQYQVNENGETYGVSIMQSEEDEPDLIAAIATNGTEGYVRSADFVDQIAATPEEVGEIVIPEEYTIPVYKSDGVTVIGEFIVNDGLNVITTKPATTRASDPYKSGTNYFTVYGNNMSCFSTISGVTRNGGITNRIEGSVEVGNVKGVKHAKGNLGCSAHLYSKSGSLVKRGDVIYSSSSSSWFIVSTECPVVPGQYFCAGGAYVYNKGIGKYTMKETQWSKYYSQTVPPYNK